MNEPPNTMSSNTADPIYMGIVPNGTLASSFVDCFERVAECAHRNALEKGFHKNPRSILEEIALMHSELSEALEGARHGNPPDDKIPTFTATEAEYADTVIRIMDSARKRGMRVGEAIIAKMMFNAGREYMHGKTA